MIDRAADGKMRAHDRIVQSGPVLAEEVLIIKGLSVGEQVASSGSFKLRDAVLVTVADHATAAATATAGGSK